MTVYALENALLGVAADRPAIDDPTIPRNGSQPPTYICIDTLEVFQDTGSAWLLVGRFGLAGLTSDDNHTLIVQDGFAAGNVDAADVPDFHSLFGQTTLTDAPGNNVDGDNVVQVSQLQPVPSGGFGPPLMVMLRQGDISAQDYSRAMVRVVDTTASTQPVLTVFKNAATRLQVDGTGVQVTGEATASNASLAGAGGATPTLAVTKLAGQTGLLIACSDENAVPKVSIAVDGEIVTADDVLAPTGIIKGATVGLYASGTGAPSSGTHSQGEFHADTAGALFYCIADGTPGTWRTVTLT